MYVYVERHRLQFSWTIPFSDFLEVFRYRFLPIPIFFLRTIIDSIYKQKSMQISIKNYLPNERNIQKITIPPIWSNLQIWSHLNNSKNKVLSYWKEEDIFNLKLVPVCNKTDVISHCL